MKMLMKAVWYLEAALCGCLGWLMLVVGLRFVVVLWDAQTRLEFYALAGMAIAFVLVYAWQAQRRQRAKMLKLLEFYFGDEKADRCDYWHEMLAAFSVAAVVGSVFLAIVLEQKFGKMALDVGFGLPVLLGIAGILANVVEAAFVKWMPSAKTLNVIYLRRR